MRLGHQRFQAAEFPHVNHAPHGVHDTPGPQEEQRLEKGVRHQVEHRPTNAHQRSRPQPEEHEPQLAHGRVGQHPLQVVLREGDQGGQQGSDATDQRHKHLGVGGGLEERCAAGHEVHPRGHHRRGVNQGRHRSGPLHRIGQPDMQWELGALADRSGEKAQADGGHQGGIRGGDAGQPTRLQHLGDLGGPEGGPDQEHADGEAKVTNAVDDKRLHPGRRGLGLFVPEADQQVAAQTNRFPEDKELQEAGRQDQHDHREDEQPDNRKEPPVTPFAMHVARGVDHDECRHERQHRQHGRRERVDPQRDRQIETGRGAVGPGDLGLDNLHPAVQRHGLGRRTVGGGSRQLRHQRQRTEAR